MSGSDELWDRRFLELAAHVGSWSRDASARTGCVIAGVDRIVRSTGYNGFARKVGEVPPERHARPDKYLWTEHAERNAVYNAARLGVPLLGCTCYVNWSPCAECARAVIQCGLARVVGLEPGGHDEVWGSSMAAAREMLSEAGVEVRLYAFDDLLARAKR